MRGVHLQEIGGLTDAIEAEKSAGEVKLKIVKAQRMVDSSARQIEGLAEEWKDPPDALIEAAAAAHIARYATERCLASLMKVDWEEELKRSGI